MNVNYRTFQDLAVCIRNGIHKLPYDLDLIVGIPRSGMVPAYMIALMMNRPVCSIDEFIHGVKPSNGERRLNDTDVGPITKKKHILIVDDSIHSGIAYRKAKERLNKCDMSSYQIEWLAVYARQETKDIPDYYFEILETPRVFEWNYLNSSIISKACFDIDGVLCVDPTEKENDDGPEYRRFLLNATPLFIPQIKIHTIVTSRLEKYRPETEAWLKAHNVQYDNLRMLDLPSKEERIRLKAHASFKAQVYGGLKDTYIFYESNREQAKEIAAITGKPCFCVETDEIFYGNESNLMQDETALSMDIRGLKVLLYTHELTYTGAPHSLLRICNILLKNKCEVEVWSPVDGEFKVEFERVGVNVRVVENPALKSPKYIQIISSFDLAIANTVLAHRFYLAANKLIPTIWFIRESLNLPSMVDSVAERRQALVQAPELYCVSEFAEQFINQTYNHNTRVIHNCVEDYYNIDTGISEQVEAAMHSVVKSTKVKFAIIGNVKYNKGFDLCVDAFNQLPSELQEAAHLFMVGRLPNADKEYWENILQATEENKNITYFGEITDQQEKISFFREIDVIIVASRSEACSLVALEAAMMGKPIILNQHVGAKYIVTGNCGWVISPDDANELSRTMGDIIRNPEMLPVMGMNSRKRYLQTSTMAHYEKAIVKMVAGNAGIGLSNNRMKMRENELVKTLSIRENETIMLRGEIKNIQNSWTYKIGRFITFFPRKVRGGIQCYIEHGAAYTTKRLWHKIKDFCRS